MDGYLRLVYRLYEALYLLHILGRVRGLHRIMKLDSTSLTGIRRRFLSKLAFLCDNLKGGPSTAAIAVQDRPDCNIFWIASNEGPSDEVLTFLKEVLQSVKDIATYPETRKPEAEELLARRCASFSSRKIKKQTRNLRSSVRKCIEYTSAELLDENGKVSFHLNNTEALY